MIHISRTRRSEIVIFGRSQKLLPPVVLGTGAILLNAADKDEQIEISKIVPSKFRDADIKLRTSLDLPEVIRRVANLGTTYPERWRSWRPRTASGTCPARWLSMRFRSPTSTTFRRRFWARTSRPRSIPP